MTITKEDRARWLRQPARNGRNATIHRLVDALDAAERERDEARGLHAEVMGERNRGRRGCDGWIFTPSRAH